MALSGASTVSRFIKGGLLLLLLGVCAALYLATTSVRAVTLPLPFYSSEDFTAEWMEPSDPRLPKLHRIAPFSLRNQAGELVTNATLQGKIYVDELLFHRLSGHLSQDGNQPAAGPELPFISDEEVLLVSHSVMPEKDSQDVLRSYAADNGVVAGKWHLLTGDKESIYSLARRSYFAEKQLGFRKDSGEFLHTENMLLIDRHGRIRGIYNATLPVDADRAIEDIHQLKHEQ
jgi:protein SCO1/2